MTGVSSERRWSEPGAEEVASGVFRVTTSMPDKGLVAVNSYAIVEPDGLVFIDGGWAQPESLHELCVAVESIGYKLSDIKRFLVTHMHRDHYSLPLMVRREVGASVSLGLGEVESIEALARGSRGLESDQLVRWGVDPAARPAASRADEPGHEDEPYESPDDWIEGPADIALESRTLRAIPTPGHTRGHLIFADFANNLLFSGDHVLPRITPSLGYEPLRGEYPLEDFLRSLALLQALPDMRLLPAHGFPGESVHERVSELMDHHARRLVLTRSTVDGGAATALEAARGLTWTRHDLQLDELDELNQMLAVGETSAHLDVLVRRGDLVVSHVAGVAEYAQALRVTTGTDPRA